MDAAPRLGAALDATQFGFLCDKAGRMFVPRFIDAVYRLKRCAHTRRGGRVYRGRRPSGLQRECREALDKSTCAPHPACALLPLHSISEKGTLQLSIDTDSVRRLLLEFPRAAAHGGGGGGASSGGGDGGGAGSSYAHYVEREMGGAVNLIKVLQVSSELGRPAPGSYERGGGWLGPAGVPVQALPLRQVLPSSDLASHHTPPIPAPPDPPAQSPGTHTLPSTPSAGQA